MEREGKQFFDELKEDHFLPSGTVADEEFSFLAPVEDFGDVFSDMDLMGIQNDFDLSAIQDLSSATSVSAEPPLFGETLVAATVHHAPPPPVVVTMAPFPASSSAGRATNSRRRQRQQSAAAKAPPKYLMSLDAEGLSEKDRKSIKKAQQCQAQRKKKAAESKAKDDKILALQEKVARQRAEKEQLVARIAYLEQCLQVQQSPQIIIIAQD